MYQTTNPGLAPWAMQEYRPYRAPLRLPIYFYFDAVALQNDVFLLTEEPLADQKLN